MRKRIILALIPDKGFGGAERVFNKVNNTLLEKYDVHECFFNTDNRTYYESNCKEHSLDIHAATNPLKSIKNFILRVYRFRRLVKQLDADIVISHLEGADFVSILSGTKAKKICVIHGTKKSDSKIRGFKGAIRKLMIKFLYGKANRIVTVSEALKEEMIQNTIIQASNVQCIYNEVNQNIINQLKEQPIDTSIKHIFENDVLIVNSRLDNVQKNLISLLQIFKKVKQKRNNIKLVMTGDGEDRELLYNHAKKIGLKVSSYWNKNLSDPYSDLYFLGYQKNPFNLISYSKALLLTSNYEGFPLGLIEALACNTLVVSSDCPTGPSEILNGAKVKSIDELNLDKNCGILLEIPKKENKSSLQLWANIIVESLNNRDLVNDLKNNRSITLKKIEPEVIFNKWVELIRSID